MSNLIQASALLSVLALGSALPTGHTHTSAGQPGCLVASPNGDVQGREVGAACVFQGIPYAAPPTGARRWKAPESSAPFLTTFPATTPPPSCPNVNSGSPAGNEDCLKLNVWVRNPRPTTPAPVTAP